MARLKQKYQTEIVPQMKEAKGYRNVMQVPRVTKVVVNMGTGTKHDRDALKAVVEDLALITGQRPITTKSRKSIANFKLRQDMPIGAKVTLRGARMYEFLDRLINSALPRIRDFRGVPPGSFDGRGNYTLGLKDQTIFPEIDPDRVKAMQGMDITICTTATSNDDARELLKLLGMPFAV
ncbi:MAG: 50S ribosomal protein L5 [Kiritimatiellae bacterium]|nr:50S ribosomal protein L5 [Kiritimatiellia bacterium]